ncbi:hypothetical protein D8X55_04455 [Malacoplasma penetrans]|uniref:Predicted integral membrane protein n=1 Tax=Malacoplasma penetrans (strain HF-2) TaxID=272633 RepID=Q8EWH0_MALP2|nr:MYPE2350 family membrane protein [Malacoplasma penetrans]RXY96217.1 hypothetical protein D8X55_04455 [Malacoplasma penetrans]BAC44026.1 predicted integral membrane protein [Malacoplasma penetrans HF-2]
MNDNFNNNGNGPALDPTQGPNPYNNNGGYNNNNNPYNNNGYNNNGYNPYMNNQAYNPQENVNLFTKIKKHSKNMLIFYFTAIVLAIIGAILISVGAAKIALSLSNNYSGEYYDLSSFINGEWIVGVLFIVLTGIFYLVCFVIGIILVIKVNDAQGKHPEFQDITMHTVLLIIGIVILPICAIIDCFILYSKSKKALASLNAR